ncbi:hypothetical protein GFD25_07410 [Bifidobacterium aerophilum]|uniref:HTH cro/C1-type domain-containing protein n=2 Tax=Bifidobacterium aerophilum TaxID=1798155 RepID=A0A6N9Z521_9BIFI|nr:helix-turn-helix transcriptional regulator [Bifidobacterium aerophilum]NEG89809.1 hypothetical protein [Bifidobacterium aerophilum]
MDQEVSYAESVISRNVKLLLAAQGKSQSSLATAMGIRGATMTNKIKGRIAWSVADLVRAADFLGTSANALMDDTMLKQLQGMGNKKASENSEASNKLLRLGLNQRPSD